MRSDPVARLLANLRQSDVRFAVDGERIRLDAPKGVLSEEQLDLLRAHRAAVRERLETELRLLDMSFEDLAESNLAIEISVPWLKDHLWLVPNEAGAQQLINEGIERGYIWTAADLIDLYQLDALGPTDRRGLAILRAHFGIEVISISKDHDA